MYDKMDLDLEIKEENPTMESTKCGEILRNLCGQYTFLCFHCGNVYKFVEHLLKHIETHFIQHEPKEPSNFIESLEIEPISVLKNESNYEVDPIEVETFYDIDFNCKAESLDSVCSDLNNWKEVESPTISLEGNTDSNNKCRISKDSPSTWNHHNKLCNVDEADNVFSCPICKMSKGSKKDLDKHRTMHNSVNPLNCTICHRIFSKPVDFLYHAKVHENLREYQCFYCELRFNIPRYRAEHEKRCKKIGIFENNKRKIPSNESINVEMISTTEDVENPTFSLEADNDNDSNKPQNVIEINNILSCPICKLTKKSKEDLDKHETMHNSTNPLNCAICCRTFSKPVDFLYHAQIHENLREYQCSYCELRFNIPRYKVQHEKRCSKKEVPSKENINVEVMPTTPELEIEQYKCDKCEKTFGTPYLLAYHQKLHDLIVNGNSFKCPICKMTKNTKDDLEKHGIAHNSANPMVCGICQKLYRRPGDLLVHIQVHENLREFECQYCKLTFNVIYHRNNHEKLCSKKQTEETKHLICYYCENIFQTKSQMVSHHRSHQNLRTYKCNLCNAKFNLKTDLTKHIQDETTWHDQSCEDNECNICQKIGIKRNDDEIHNRSLRSYKCILCDEQFNFRQSLRLHHKSIHSTKDIYKCTICGLRIKQKCNYKRHLMIHERDENTKKPFECHLCDKAYFLNNSLKVHIRSHTGERPYQCSECGLTFANQSRLTLHVKKKHSTVKPFECDLCGRCFTMRFQLGAHMRLLHTQSRNHVCSVCDKRFKARKYLRQHELLHGPEKKQQCRYCDMRFAQRSALIGHEKSRHLIV